MQYKILLMILIILRKQIITDYDPSDGIIDEFKDSAKKLDYFKSTFLVPHGLENIDSFYFALLFAIRYQLNVALMS